jgi:2-deoxy-D-gluconate 3-dehydrogenase
MKKLFSLEGMNAVITGGGKGIGKSIAEGYLEYGAEVVITGSSDAIYETSDEFKNKGFDKIHPVKMNLLDRRQRASAFEECIETLKGQLDILVNNAGITKRVPIDIFPIEAWDEIIEVNLTSVFDLSRRAVEVMKKRQYGKIIHNSSLAAFISTVKNIPAYQAAKAGVRQLTMCFADEWSQYGIRTNAIAPGFTHTQITNEVLEDKERYEKSLQRIPLGRWATTDDLKGVAIMLASHAGDYINGITIVVDGGMISRLT